MIALKAPPNHHDSGIHRSVSTLVCPTPVSPRRPILVTRAPRGSGAAAPSGALRDVFIGLSAFLADLRSPPPSAAVFA